MWKILKYGLGIVILLAVIGALVGEDSGSGSDTAAKPETKAVVPEEEKYPKPQSQQVFVGIVAKAKKDWESAKTDMQKGAAFANRNAALCKAQGVGVTDWVGKVYDVTTNSEGKGVLVVEIGHRVWVSTWNNAMSDIMDETLIPTNSSVFASAASLKSGDMVKFSGKLFTDPESCFGEQSLMLSSKVNKPTFTFRFSSVSPL